MCKLCDENDGDFQTCQDCGAAVCFDVKGGDDIVRRAAIGPGGDLLCDWHAMRQADQEEEWEEWDRENYYELPEGYDDLLP